MKKVSYDNKGNGNNTRVARLLKVLAPAILALVIVTGCKKQEEPNSIEESQEKQEISFVSITQEEAKQKMDSVEDLIILDVRTQEEYDSGYIKEAILLPVDEIEQKAEALLLDKDQTILVYCRSGRRSVIASEALAKLGYTKVYEFGGINDWKYDIAP